MVFGPLDTLLMVGYTTTVFYYGTWAFLEAKGLLSAAASSST